MVGRQAIVNPHTGKEFYVPVKPKTIAQRIVEIRKSLNKENLQPEQRTHTSKKGTQYQQRHWVKKQQTNKIELNKMQAKENIPTIELEELPGNLNIKNYSVQQFRKLLFLKFNDKQVQNKHTGANILIPKSGIRHSLSNKYSPESVNITRASILQLDKLLQSAIRIKIDSDKRSDENVLQVDTYQIKIKTVDPYHGYQYYNVNLVVKKRKDTGETFYDHLVIYEEK